MSDRGVTYRGGDWRDRARCTGRDPSTWFPEYRHGADEALALTATKTVRSKRACLQCPVRRECLEEGLRVQFYIDPATGQRLHYSNDWGVFAGTLPFEREAALAEPDPVGYLMALVESQGLEWGLVLPSEIAVRTAAA